MIQDVKYEQIQVAKRKYTPYSIDQIQRLKKLHMMLKWNFKPELSLTNYTVFQLKRKDY